MGYISGGTDNEPELALLNMELEEIKMIYTTKIEKLLETLSNYFWNYNIENNSDISIQYEYLEILDILFPSFIINENTVDLISFIPFLFFTTIETNGWTERIDKTNLINNFLNIQTIENFNNIINNTDLDNIFINFILNYFKPIALQEIQDFIINPQIQNNPDIKPNELLIPITEDANLIEWLIYFFKQDCYLSIKKQTIETTAYLYLNLTEEEQRMAKEVAEIERKREK